MVMELQNRSAGTPFDDDDDNDDDGDDDGGDDDNNDRDGDGAPKREYDDLGVGFRVFTG